MKITFVVFDDQMVNVVFDLNGQMRVEGTLELPTTWKQVKACAEDLSGISDDSVKLLLYGREITDFEIQAEIVEGDEILMTWNLCGSHPIHCAAAFGNLLAVRRWISAGTAVDLRDKSGCTPLLRAVFNGYTNGLVRELILCGADVHAKDRYQQTPLSVAFNRANLTELVNALRERGDAPSIP